MKLNPKFLTHEAKGEHYIISTPGAAFNGIVKSNETAALIVETLKKGASEQELVDLLLNTFDGAERSAVEKDVTRIIGQLRNIGAIED